jgi:hypothetical protein
MRRALLLLSLLPSIAGAQDFLRYYPPSGGGGADPTYFSSPGGSVVIGGVANAVTLDLDSSAYPVFSSGTADPPATCLVGERYIETDTAELYTCIDDDPDTWQLQGTLSSAYTVIDDEDTPLTARTTLNFEGDGVTCADDTNQTTCTIAGGSSSFDPVTYQFYEDFAGGEAVTLRTGQNGLSFTAISTGTVSGPAITDFSTGGLRLNSHATNDNSGATVHGITQITPNAGDWAFDARVMPGAASTAITDAAMYVGLTSNALPDTTSRGVFARFDSAFSDSKWVFVLCDSATTGCQEAGDATNADTELSSVTPAAGTIARIRIWRTSADSTIHFKVDSETEVTFCASGCTSTAANLPTTASGFGITYLTRTTTGVLVGAVDYIFSTATR